MFDKSRLKEAIVKYKEDFVSSKYDYSPSAYDVFDVKNKAYGQFKNADIYQILTYIRLLHSKKVVLLYPAFQQKTEILSLYLIYFRFQQW